MASCDEHSLNLSNTDDSGDIKNVALACAASPSPSAPTHSSAKSSGDPLGNSLVTIEDSDGDEGLTTMHIVRLLILIALSASLPTMMERPRPTAATTWTIE